MKLKNSNTTFVNVKRCIKELLNAVIIDSNTTFVNVKH